MKGGWFARSPCFISWLYCLVVFMHAYLPVMPCSFDDTQHGKSVYSSNGNDIMLN